MVPSIQDLTDNAQRLGNSLDWWNTTYLVLVFATVVLAGGTFVAQFVAIAKGKKLSVVQSEIIMAKDAQLKLDLQEKESAIAGVRQETADALESAKIADLKRVELENRMVDIFGRRQLTTEQSARIVKRLAGLEGAKIDVYVYGVDNPYAISDFEDPRKIGVEVVRILQRAHMDAAGWLLKDCHGSWATGLVIATTGDNTEDTRIGSQLIKAFQRETGTDPNVEKSLSPPNWCTTTSDLDKSAPNKRQHDAKISIIVGKKFAPILTREMLEPTDEENKP